MGEKDWRKVTTEITNLINDAHQAGNTYDVPKKTVTIHQDAIKTDYTGFNLRQLVQLFKSRKWPLPHPTRVSLAGETQYPFCMHIKYVDDIHVPRPQADKKGESQTSVKSSPLTKVCLA